MIQRITVRTSHPINSATRSCVSPEAISRCSSARSTTLSRTPRFLATIVPTRTSNHHLFRPSLCDNRLKPPILAETGTLSSLESGATYESLTQRVTVAMVVATVARSPYWCCDQNQ